MFKVNLINSHLGDNMARRQKKASLQAEIDSSKAFHIQPKNETQNYLLECIQKNIMTVVIGPAGTGKTYCTGMKAAQLYSKAYISTSTQ